jgi:hypothetical protein
METVTLSKRELDRLDVIRRVRGRHLTQREAATILGIGERQVRRLCAELERMGPAGLVSRRRGQPSNNRLPADVRVRALTIVRSRYPDFGPTLANEKLAELHDLHVSVETLRKWMVEDGLWVPRSRRRRRAQQPRVRRACFGELVQIDGCEHHWFEERGSKCTLLVFVDDASGRLMELLFCRSETAFDYFEAMRGYLARFGKPVALYSDKASIFRVNASAPSGGDGFTQFGRAMNALNIDLLCANTPAAKGRVERAHLTLQDRLVKELRLRGISTMEDGNAFLPAFIEDYNRRFARAPRSEHDAHRPLLANEELNDIFTWQETRKVTRNLTVNYKRVLYLLDPTDAAHSAMGHRIQVFETRDGAVMFRHDGHELPATAFPKEGKVRQGEVVEHKRLDGALEWARTQQRLRDEAKAEAAHVTLREADILARGTPRRTGVPVLSGT